MARMAELQRDAATLLLETDTPDMDSPTAWRTDYVNLSQKLLPLQSLCLVWKNSPGNLCTVLTRRAHEGTAHTRSSRCEDKCGVRERERYKQRAGGRAREHEKERERVSASKRPEEEGREGRERQRERGEGRERKRGQERKMRVGGGSDRGRGEARGMSRNLLRIVEAVLKNVTPDEWSMKVASGRRD